MVSTKAPPVLKLTSRPSLKQMKLILYVGEMQHPEKNQIDMLKEYSDVFEGLGMHAIRFNPGAVPLIHPPRRIPVALRERDKLQKELKRMEDLGLISKLREPRASLTSIAKSEKHQTGALRVVSFPEI